MPLAARTADRPLLAREEAFVGEYFVDYNAYRAFRMAGYKTDPSKDAHRLMKRPSVAKAIAARKKALADANGISADRVIEELRRVGFLNARDLFDSDGNLIPVNKLPEAISAAIHPTEVVQRNLAAGDGVTDRVHRIRVHDKLKALELLGKKLGLFVDKVEHSVSDDLATLIRARFQRA